MVASNHLSHQFKSPHDVPYADEPSGKLGMDRFDDQLMKIDMPHELNHFRDVMIGDDDPSESDDVMEDTSTKRAKNANKIVQERIRNVRID